MLDIEAKLSSFRKMIWDEEKEKTDEELFSSTDRNSSFLDEKKTKREEEFQAKIKERENFLELRKNEEISRIKEEEKNNYYAYKEALLNDFYNKLVLKLKDYKKSSAYKEKLSSEIKKIVNELNLDEDKIIFCLVEDDINIVNYKNKEVIDNSYIGGVILKDINNEFRYNFTYREKIRESKYEFGKKIYQIFERESFNESNN